MSAEPVSSIHRHSLALGGFALLAALLLGLVYGITAERISEQQQLAERRALAEVLPDRFHDNDLLAASGLLNPEDLRFRQPSLLGLTTSRTYYVARLNGSLSATILPVEVHDGYSGDILLLVGILADGSISGVRVLEHRETPGLGDKIDIAVSDWITGFEDKSLDNPPAPRWQVVKDGGDFDQLAGATITPRAVVNGVRKALQFFEINRNVFYEL